MGVTGAVEQGHAPIRSTQSGRRAGEGRRGMVMIVEQADGARVRRLISTWRYKRVRLARGGRMKA